MRQIVKAILRSEVPVILYVYPSGSRAASAGTFIAYAAHVSAMTPGTAIGAATPVNVGGADVQKDLARKVQNDAVSYIRSLATQRGRNADWAEKAVRVGGSLPEDEALKLHVVDFVARDLDELLEKVDGRKVEVAGATRTLHTAGAEHHGVPPSLRQRLLSRIVDPNVAYILFILGFYGLIFELSNPGAILPGIVGGIAILLALLAFQTLPVNMAGVFLILFAMLLFLVEVKVHSHGLLTVGGALAMAIGGLMLFDDRAVHVAWPLVIATTAVTVAMFMVAVAFAIRGRRGPRASGKAALLGRRALVIERLVPRGRVRLDAEVWNAEAAGEIDVGAEVVVTGVEGLTLRVRPAAKGA